jgi:type 1 glutamine amidotransferase
MDIEPVTKHPVLTGIGKFHIFDETYKDLWLAQDNTVLLRTKEASSDGPVAWISSYKPSRVAVIQLGHGPHAHTSADWRTLVRNAILWAGKRDPQPIH